MSPYLKGNLEFLKNLNPAQLEAVQTIEGPLLVIAGAGSGKTRTITSRLAYLVAKGISPEKILLLTFTRKAAREMIERAQSMLKTNFSRITGGTFHSVSQYLLRFYASLIGYSSNFSIIDRSDAEDLINLLKNSLGFGNKKKRFPTKTTLMNIYSKQINLGKSLEEILEKEYPQFLEYLPEIERLFSEYVFYKKEHNLMDYDDLLLNWLSILKSFPSVRKEIGEKFQFIMVDEYQDTNRLQGEIIKFMAEEHKNVMVVGDDSQSIYGFRGAYYKNIFEFPKLFPNTKIIKLEENYRSTQPILDVANAIISSSRVKYTKNLFSRKKEGEKPVLFFGKDELEAAKFVADQVLKLREKGIKLSQIAVLFRSAFHSFDLEVELAKRNIPFVKYGGLKLLEAAHIKDFLSFLKILINPLDLIAWNRIFLLLEGVGPRTAEKLIVKIKGASQNLFTGTQDFLRIFSPFTKIKELEKLAKFLNTLYKEKSSLPLSTILKKILEFYEPIFNRVYYEDYTRREKDLETLLALGERYKTAEEFLADLIIEPVEVEGESFQKDEEHLVLSTIHSAKGLEWHTVFVISLVEGRFPSLYSMHNPEELEEERRLFYVAVTRAREKLFLVCPMTIYMPGEGKVLAKVSRFVKDIPPSLLNLYKEEPEEEKAFEESFSSSASLSQASRFKKGDLVRHPHFGEGEVLEIVGNEKVKVFFPQKGPTTLHLKYAKLEKINI